MLWCSSRELGAARCFLTSDLDNLLPTTSCPPVTTTLHTKGSHTCTKECQGHTWERSQALARRCPRGTREGRRRGVGWRRGCRGHGAGGQGAWGGRQAPVQAARPAPPAALTRGPGGVARRCGSSRPAAAAAAAAEAGTHHAAAFMAWPGRAGPEPAPRLGSVLPGRWEGGAAAAPTREPEPSRESGAARPPEGNPARRRRR
ncbi:small nuclear ribonucleoprotein-associated protein B'-like [Hippopotamus amphibius kiboko]|uniref:small nuclear ribonucleoprotein-associated protein B'-like n=1 Tax=Hippopotamus amphibius kiboko TaxID=575201 RepID=UPI002594F92A|nr:small nuclear ribonucleoprotein-associated protein B'-like [Hippopotamus amphibius kiboko]